MDTHNSARSSTDSRTDRHAGETRYEVAVDVEPALAERFERFMRETHIPEIYATGCFREAHFDRASATRFRTVYVAATPADLERYLDEHTADMRAIFAKQFPMGAVLSREVWTTLERWPRGETSRDRG